MMFTWAQLALAEEQPSGFGAPVLDAPPRSESGPLAKQPIDRRAGEAPANTVDLPAPDQTPTAETALPASAPIGDQTQLKAYVDGLMSGLITSGQFPGAVVLVIQDGKVTLKAGYGFADVRAQLPVDPDRTRFRVASVSKLVTATAVIPALLAHLIDYRRSVAAASANAYSSRPSPARRSSGLRGFRTSTYKPSHHARPNVTTSTAIIYTHAGR